MARRPTIRINTALALLSLSHLYRESCSFQIGSPSKHNNIHAAAGPSSHSNCWHRLPYSSIALFSSEINGSSGEAVDEISGNSNDLYGRIQRLRKQKEFQHLPEDVVSLVPRSTENNAETRIISSKMRENGDDIVPINTIVLQIHSDNGAVETVLVVLSAQDKIDMKKLHQIWKEKQPSVQRVELAPSDQVISLVGYDPGCIPPIGHSVDEKVQVFPTILEESLIQNTPRRQLLGGGGSEAFLSLIRLPVLVGMDHVEIASIGVGNNNDIDEGQGVNDEDEKLLSTLPQRRISLPTWGLETRPRPFFPVETPSMEEAQEILANSDTHDLPPVDATWVTLVGTLGGVRRVSKRLIFCDLLPAGYESNGQNEQNSTTDNLVADSSFAKEWRSAIDGMDLSVQLIGGSTLLMAMGEVRGQAALKSLQTGKTVLIQAKLNVLSSRESLEHWVAERRLDLALVSFQILYDTSPATRQGSPVPQSLPTPTVVQPNKPYLEFKDVMDNSKDSQDIITVVDDSESLQILSDHVSVLLDSLGEIDSVVNGDNDASPPTMKYELIGLDCEWKPNFYLNNPQDKQPVLVLQISIQDRVYVVDMQSLARPCLSPDASPTAEEITLNGVLEKIFSSKKLFKVGFQLLQDLQKLAASYSHMKAFQLVFGVVEASTLATKVVRSRRHKNSKLITSSLNRLTEYFVDRSVNKEQQVSDWSQRPMTSEQIEYAALDAIVTVAVVKQCFEELGLFVFSPGPKLGRWEGDSTFMKMLASYKFLFLQPDADFHVVKKLKAKKVVNGYPLLVVTQTWETAKDAPKLPSVPDDDTEGAYTDVFGILQVPSTTVRIRSPNLSLEEERAFVTSMVAKRTGKSKEKSLTSLLVSALSANPEILPEDSRLQYPARSGYIEFEDGVALFVNMPEKSNGSGNPRSYPNEWLEDGKILTWFVREYEWQSGTTKLAKKVLNPDSLVFLFVRVMNKNYFLCCGPCQVREPETKTEIVSKEKQERWDLVQLNLEVLEYDILSSSNDFLSLVV